MNNPLNILVHHSVTPRDLDLGKTEASIERNHKERQFPLSQLGWHIGYHYIIYGNGVIKQYRKDNEVGAHCKEQSMNFKSLAVCLIGNFDVENPSSAQIATLTAWLKDKGAKYNIPTARIYPHRKFAINPATGKPYKSCYGNRLPDKWAANLINAQTMSNALLVKKGGTYGYFLPATSEQALIDKALNFGYPLPTKNDGKEVDWPNVKPEITLDN